MTPSDARKLHSAFVLSIVIKGLNGVLETGLGLIFLSTGYLQRLIHRLSQMDMIADPHGWLGHRLHKALAEMDPKFRIVVVMRMLQGYSTKETAEILKLPLGTVLSRLSRAQEQLKNILSKL